MLRPETHLFSNECFKTTFIFDKIRIMLYELKQAQTLP